MSFTHWQVPAVHVKFSLPLPLGQPQLIVPPQLLLNDPHWLPMPAAGQVFAVQQTFGFATVLQVWPLGQLHVRVPPHPFGNGPQASPPGWPGPPGTFAQVYGAPRPFAQSQVPTWPGVLVEQTVPLPHAQLIVPPMPLSRPVPHLPAYGALPQVRADLHTPGPSVPATHW